MLSKAQAEVLELVVRWGYEYVVSYDASHLGRFRGFIHHPEDPHKHRTVSSATHAALRDALLVRKTTRREFGSQKWVATAAGRAALDEYRVEACRRAVRERGGDQFDRASAAAKARAQRVEDDRAARRLVEVPFQERREVAAVQAEQLADRGMGMSLGTIGVRGAP